ncbi:hypothetical protein TWF694_001592 [Orbilia ellipsospora]|uniref:Pentatricopeptide repeat-containing protein n=1 Tax=Orbilia ellipsospora TaxID=2528407 RepID=A0AAV9X427_9PEZI
MHSLRIYQRGAKPRCIPFAYYSLSTSPYCFMVAIPLTSFPVTRLRHLASISASQSVKTCGGTLSLFDGNSQVEIIGQDPANRVHHLTPHLLARNTNSGGVMKEISTKVFIHNNRLLGFWKLFNSNDTTARQLFSAYLELPSPRLQYFSQEQVYTLLSKLSNIKRGDEGGILQYLTVIDDMKIGRIPIPRQYWNMAIGFVAKSYRQLSDHDLQSGLFLWKEMEKSAGVSADVTTFNILFHLAASSDMPHLPLMMLKEMRRRKLPMDRFTYVNLIMYYGKQGNSRGIRNTYREFIGMGEFVDIVFFNAIMTALIDTGEPQAAEDILTHLTRLPRTKQTTTHYFTVRESRLHKDIKELKKTLGQQGFDTNIDFDQQLPIPNLVSFAIFIDYHAGETADFGKILSLLRGLSECGIESETSILQSLYKGFALHGRLKYTPWTLQRLNAVFEAFVDGSYPIGRDAALWCLRAYVVLAGKERGKEIWMLLKYKWVEQGGDTSEILEVEHKLSKMRQR